MAARDDELSARLEAWAEIHPLSEAGTLEARKVNEQRPTGVRVFYGGRGVWTDKARLSALAPDGVTVGVLHTGRHYADELEPDGIIYHYPRTSQLGRDRQEVEATRAARGLGLPVFVVVQPDSTSRRIVHLGWIEDMDDETEEVLIMFGEAPPPAPPVPDDDSPFELERPPGGSGKKTFGTARPGQTRFAFCVMSRYGARCAVCEVSVKAVLECNHLRPYAQNGSDDPRNGLVLCRTHHRAFEKHLFGIDPSTFDLSFRKEGPSAAELAITRTSIAHLPALPHVDALSWCWEKFGAA